jgi:uncharacterized protein YndB with AHSA1/START domain
MDPIRITYAFDRSRHEVWNALSKEAELKKWYFPVQNYLFEAGREFTFYESEDSHHFLHRCRFLNIIPGQLIEYTWAHPSHSKGSSVVKWELHQEGEKTRVTLTHTGVENFADAGEAFSRANYEMGWDAIVKNMLRNYLYGIRKLVFNIEISVAPSKVWHMLWDRDNYPRWAMAFTPGSFYTGDLKPGGRIHFLAPSGNGIYSDIAFCRENELMIFRHLGMIGNKVELPIDAETEKWTGIFETYRLSEQEGKTHLAVEANAMEGLYEYLENAFPLALNMVKEICEMNQSTHNNS